MNQQEEPRPTMIMITRGKEQKPEPPEKVKKEPKARPVTSTRARRAQSFEDSLEPWLLAGKPTESKVLYAWWWLYASLKLYKIAALPQPRTILSYDKAAERIMDKISDLRHQTMAIVTVMTAKGGATKTTIATWLASTLAEATKLPPTVFDTNRGGGKAAGRYELDKDDMVSTRTITKRVLQGETPEYDDLLDVTGTDKLTGVMVIHHIAGHGISENTMVKTVLDLKRRFHSLIIDTSPNLEDPSTVGASSVSTVRVVVGKASSKEDLDDIDETLSHKKYQLRDQLNSVVIALSDLPGNNCGTRQQFAFADRFKVRPEQIVLIPFDPHLKKVGMVRRSKLTPQARYAMSRLAEVVCDTAIAVTAEAKLAQSPRRQARH